MKDLLDCMMVLLAWFGTFVKYKIPKQRTKKMGHIPILEGCSFVYTVGIHHYCSSNQSFLANQQSDKQKVLRLVQEKDQCRPQLQAGSSAQLVTRDNSAQA